MSTTALAAEEVRQRSSIRTIQLWAGEPAPSIPLDVPVPNDAGLNHAGDGVLNPTKRDRAMLTSADDLPVVIAMYRAELGVRGWQEVRSWLSHPVDATAGPSTVVSAFCQSAEGPALLVAVVSAAAQERNIQLRLYPGRPGPCDPAGSEAAPAPWNGDPPMMH